MYRGTYIDALGRKRTAMGYYTLNKANEHKANCKVVIVQARDKASAANKINREYRLSISPSHLRQVPKTEGELLMKYGFCSKVEK